MRITRVKWCNYRPFDTEIRFDDSEQIILFNWVNGTGKTSFLNSISWCLTGKEIFKSDRYIPNGEAVKNAFETGEALWVSVEIEFKNGAGLASMARRSQSYRAKTINSVVEIESIFEVQVETDGGFTSLNSSDSKEWAQENFPNELIENFLVNGQAWATDRAKKRRGVEAVSQVDALRRVVDHLKKVRDGYVGKSQPKRSESNSKYTPALEGLTTKIEDFEASVEQAESQLADFSEQNGDLQEWFEKCQAHNERLLELKGKDELVQNTKLAKDHALQDFRKDLSWSLPAGLLRSQLGDLGRLLNDASDDSIPAETIDRILEENSCICGREAHSVTDVLIELRDKAIGAIGLPKYFAVELKSVREASTLAERAIGAATAHYRNYRNASEAFDTAKDARGKFVELLQGDEEDVDQRAVAAVYIDMTQKTKLLKNAPETLRELKAEQDALRQAVLREAGVTPSVEKFADLANFSGECLEAAEAILDKTMEDTRAQVQVEFERIYRKMSPESNSWADIVLTADFEIQIQDADGQDRKGGLSTGKSLALAFAFALALGKIAGYSLPLIADTPFGPLSTDVKRATVQGIKSEITEGGSSEGRQMFLLMHDEEFSDSVKDAFSNLNPTIIEGNYDSDSQLTTFAKVK